MQMSHNETNSNIWPKSKKVRKIQPSAEVLCIVFVMSEVQFPESSKTKQTKPNNNKGKSQQKCTKSIKVKFIILLGDRKQAKKEHVSCVNITIQRHEESNFPQVNL